MKIYTKTGDAGTTGFFGGARVSKDDARVEAYGSVDETNAVIGAARAHALPAEVDAVLAAVQADLFVVGAELACVPGAESRLGMTLIAQADIERLEHAIDRAEQGLAALKSFVLPGGTTGAALLHHARTVCRRAERRAVALHAASPLRPEILVYLNRLSDLLFTLARRSNHAAGVPDVPWKPRSG
jgi:cob(I)alamin adenosyltransferase